MPFSGPCLGPNSSRGLSARLSIGLSPAPGNVRNPIKLEESGDLPAILSRRPLLDELQRPSSIGPCRGERVRIDLPMIYLHRKRRPGRILHFRLDSSFSR